MGANRMIDIDQIDFTEATDARYKLQIAARNTGTLLVMYSANLCQEDVELQKTADQITNSCEKLSKIVAQIKKEINQ